MRRAILLLACAAPLLMAAAPAAPPTAGAAPSAAPADPNAPPAATAPAPDTPNEAILQGLDKTSARVSTFRALLGQTVRFGTLAISVRDCRKRPPDEEPESAAFLDISEIPVGATQPQHLFSGWMFESSPAVSALQHPVYDVWLIDCSTESGSAGKPG